MDGIFLYICEEQVMDVGYIGLRRLPIHSSLQTPTLASALGQRLQSTNPWRKTVSFIVVKQKQMDV